VDPLGSGVTLRNNTFTGSASNTVIYIAGSTGGHTVVGNVITGNSGVGLYFGSSGAMSKVEGNVIRANSYIGVEVDVSNVDFGGGAAGSAGGNTFSCNTAEDFADYDEPAPISAHQNMWDHVPPSHGQSAGIDIYDPTDGGASNINTTGATVAASNCP
jgi:hypothetical protein